MNHRWQPWIGITALCCLASCAHQLPDVAELDRSYQRSEQLAVSERNDLESRHASGQLSDADYKREKADLDRKINDRAISMVWTRHSLEEVERENLGIPTPDHPQSISVPQAGTLPTGSSYRRFNDQTGSTLGTSGESLSGMRELMGQSTLKAAGSGPVGGY